MKPFLQLKSVDEITRLIFAFPMLPSESVGLEEALGKRLAKPFFAPADLPGFRRSTMDGYAIKAQDVFGATESAPALLRLIGACKMGSIPDFTLNDGEAAEIMTGAPLPAGSDAVIMVEKTRDLGDGQIEAAASVAPGMNIVEVDEDARKDAQLIPAGKKLRAQEIGIFASFGVTNVETTRSCRAAIISTGDEIVGIADIPEPGQIRDVNSWSLAALCRANGAEVMRMGIVPDEPSALLQALQDAREKADVIVVSGGSSAGMRDHTAAAFQALPQAVILAHGAAISPGKPFIFGRSGNVCLLGLPGHVTSALVCGHVFLAPLLNHLQGLPAPVQQPWIEATLTRSIASSQGRRDYIRCKLERKDEEFLAMPLRAPSAALNSLLEADCLVICPENSEGLYKGQTVKAYPV